MRGIPPMRRARTHTHGMMEKEKDRERETERCNLFILWDMDSLRAYKKEHNFKNNKQNALIEVFKRTENEMNILNII